MDLKNLIGSETVLKYADFLDELDSGFKKQEFIKNLSKLSQLELKARVLLIATELEKHFPSTEEKSFHIIEQMITKLPATGFELWPVADYLGRYGHLYYSQSLKLMSVLTEKMSCEFAIRPFLIKNPQKTYSYLLKMSKSANVHQRRWASEGSRPRLPWGEKLPLAIQNPRAGMQILENLKKDPELYVRKSVTNHLNDISKDHPKLVIQILKKWQKEKIPNFEFIRRQALRTLIKKGDAEAMKLMGFHIKTKVQVSGLRLVKDSIQMNQSLEFHFKILNSEKKPSLINIDYVIYFKNAKNGFSRKVFKLKALLISSSNPALIKKIHKVKPITTRQFYAGEQRLSILVNGIETTKKKWNLSI